MSEPTALQLIARVIFWLAAVFVLYTYFIYPVLIGLWARLRPRPVAADPAFRPAVTVLLVGYNEAERFEPRIRNLLEQDYPADRLDIVAVSDGSTDASAAVLDRCAAADPRVKAINLERNGGKAVALNAGMEHARGEIVAFADARQRFEPDAISRLVENFADPTVGSVSGELMLESAEGGVAAQVGLYWRYEKFIRRCEAAVASMLGATGAIYAIRRALYRPLPPGTLLDDFLTPMRIVLDGHRALFDGRARAIDAASQRAGQEFRRKVRTLAGNFQAFAFEPRLLLPWTNPATWWQLWSHKVFRLFVPYAIVLTLLGSAKAGGWFYGLLFLAQVAFFLMAEVGRRIELAGGTIRFKPMSLAYTFTTLNLAAVAGAWSWLRGHNSQRLWASAPDNQAGDSAENK